MQCPSCHHVMAQSHEDKQFFYFLCKHNTCFAAGIQCKFCNLIKQSKKGCIKNIKYIMLKHYKQEHLHYCQLLLLPQCNTKCTDTNNIALHNQLHNIVNPKDSISTVSSLSQSKQTNSSALSSSTVDTQAINFLFYQFNHFDSQPNQLYFFLNMLHLHHSGAHGIVWRAINGINKCIYNVSTLEETYFVFKSYTLYPITPQNIESSDRVAANDWKL